MIWFWKFEIIKGLLKMKMKGIFYVNLKKKIIIDKLIFGLIIFVYIFLNLVVYVVFYVDYLYFLKWFL